MIRKYILVFLKTFRFSKNIEVPEIPLSDEEIQTISRYFKETIKKPHPKDPAAEFRNRILLLTKKDETELKRLRDFVLTYRLLWEKAQMEELDGLLVHFHNLPTKK
jgi:hypothetical protein